jgi:hypothetical protein
MHDADRAGWKDEARPDSDVPAPTSGPTADLEGAMQRLPPRSRWPVRRIPQGEQESALRQASGQFQSRIPAVSFDVRCFDLASHPSWLGIKCPRLIRGRRVKVLRLFLTKMEGRDNFLSRTSSDFHSSYKAAP